MIIYGYSIETCYIKTNGRTGIITELVQKKKEKKEEFQCMFPRSQENLTEIQNEKHKRKGQTVTENLSPEIHNGMSVINV